MHWSLLEEFRRAESTLVLEVLRKRKAAPARLVEIGGGSGWQAAEFQKAGYDVASFDLASSAYLGRRVFDVVGYDGHRLPVADGTADIVFSSNVLEHIPHVAAFQAEMQRVLKPDGIAVHVLPTACWRFWTCVTHYPWVAKKLVTRLVGWPQANPPPAHTERLDVSVQPMGGVASMLRNAVVPPRHGEFGNTLTEHYYFSRVRWTRLFEGAGWQVVGYETNRLAYTAHSLMGHVLSLAVRGRLSQVLGSACHVFVLAKR